MNYFFDTEFIDDGSAIHLISIGIVCEDNREFYGELSDSFIPWNRADDWVKQNIRPLLHSSYKYSPVELANDIIRFINAGDSSPRFWAFYSAWDWVVFLHIFGKMIEAPSGWPHFCMDIKQWAEMIGNPLLPTQQGTQHNALEDARWNKLAYDFLKGLDDRYITSFK
jgi:hypothetical protein